MSVSQVVTLGLAGPAPGPHWILTLGLGSTVISPYRPPLTGPRAMQKPTISGLEALGRAIDALVAGDFYDSCDVKLFSNNIGVSPNSLIADFTEADYTGYASQTLGATPVAMLNPEGDIAAQFPHLTFTPTGTTVTNTIYGYWVEGTGGGTGDRVLFAANFDPPVVLSGPLTSLIVEPRHCLGQPAGN